MVRAVRPQHHEHLFHRPPLKRIAPYLNNGQPRQIDFILIGKNMRRYVTNSGSNDLPDLGSDHLPVQATLGLPLRATRKRKRN
eukprot:2415841-Pyramimonas_sp.AAC.1